MTVTIGTQYPRHPGTYQSSESLSQSTATAFRNIGNDSDVSFLGMGTATGLGLNLWQMVATTTATGTLGDAVEGQEKLLIATATGEAKVFIGGSIVAGASATGNWVFQSDGDLVMARFVNGVWNYAALTGATQATAT